MLEAEAGGELEPLNRDRGRRTGDRPVAEKSSVVESLSGDSSVQSRNVAVQGGFA
ncbi:hypothetical protein [Streptomyces sp. NBRC 110611]|uniref:hypothetical protein n=1 Tax=Streptomyces sp. NBRC 110611 TaxID=1621259 RepID=UPI0015EF0E1D|nr:hypothetical protein [Streptomyces sp. NBRC 110611]